MSFDFAKNDVTFFQHCILCNWFHDNGLARCKDWGHGVAITSDLTGFSSLKVLSRCMVLFSRIRVFHKFVSLEIIKRWPWSRYRLLRVILRIRGLYHHGSYYIGYTKRPILFLGDVVTPQAGICVPSVEDRGFEPLTPCLQGRCSTRLS